MLHPNKADCSILLFMIYIFISSVFPAFSRDFLVIPSNAPDGMAFPIYQTISALFCCMPLQYQRCHFFHQSIRKTLSFFVQYFLLLLPAPLNRSFQIFRSFT